MPQKSPFALRARTGRAVDEEWSRGLCDLENLSWACSAEAHFSFLLCLDRVLKAL